MHRLPSARPASGRQTRYKRAGILPCKHSGSTLPTANGNRRVMKGAANAIKAKKAKARVRAKGMAANTIAVVIAIATVAMTVMATTTRAITAAMIAMTGIQTLLIKETAAAGNRVAVQIRGPVSILLPRRSRPARRNARFRLPRGRAFRKNRSLFLAGIESDPEPVHVICVPSGHGNWHTDDISKAALQYFITGQCTGSKDYKISA